MLDLTMEQITKANNFAIARDLNQEDVVEALRIVLGTGEALGIPSDKTEELFYLVGRFYD